MTRKGTRERLIDDFDKEGIPQVENNGSRGIKSVDDLVNSTTADIVSMVTRLEHQSSESNASTALNEMEDGLLDSVEVACKVCQKEIRDTSQGAVYYCIYCIDCDICEDCFPKKGQIERGEIEPDWRIVCPPGHEHIKAPVKGWRGMKGDVMRIGRAEIPFKEWMEQLETYWAEHWNLFWTETDLL